MKKVKELEVDSEYLVRFAVIEEKINRTNDKIDNLSNNITAHIKTQAKIDEGQNKNIDILRDTKVDKENFVRLEKKQDNQTKILVAILIATVAFLLQNVFF